MDYRDYYWGFCRDYYRDPFPNSLLSTREAKKSRSPSLGLHTQRVHVAIWGILGP